MSEVERDETLEADAPEAAPAEKPKKKKWRPPEWAKPAVDLGVYALVRFWAVVMECFTVDANLATARFVGRMWWKFKRSHRERAMENLRACLGDQYSEAELYRIGRASLEHWVQVYLVELVMSPRLLNRYSWPRYVELGTLGPALRELLLSPGAIMLTPHFGNYELLGFTLTRLGIPIVAVMRPVDNERLNRELVKRRAESGMALLSKRGAMEQAEEVVKSGVPLCFIADQDAGPKQYFVPFFGRLASTYKSIGLLAVMHEVPVIVGYAARSRKGYHYTVEVERVIRPPEWQDKPNAAFWITEQFSAAMESLIRKHPEQYLWMHRRWKTQPGARRKKRAAAPSEA